MFYTDCMVYLDVYLGWNLTMNWLLLGLVGRLQRKKTVWYRSLAGAAVGMIWALVVLLVHALQVPLIRVVGSVCVAWAMVCITWRRLSAKEQCMSTLTLYGSSWVFAGALLQIRSWSSISWFWNSLLYGQIPFAGAGRQITVAMLCAVVLWVLAGRLKRLEQRRRLQVEVQLRSAGQSVSTRGWIDTGNQLRTPGGHSVAVAARSLCVELLGEEEVVKAETMQGACSGWIYLSYHSVGKTNGLLPAVRLTEVTIQTEESARQVPEAWIAVGTDSVGSTMHCQIILPPDW